MRRSLLVLVILAISTGALASGYAIWSYVSSDRKDSATTAGTGSSDGAKPSGSSRVAAMAPPAAMTPGGPLAIEVARIEAGGASVLAGRALPNHKVTILANGREIATVTATDEGQWSAIVTEGIAAGPLELSIASEPKDGGAKVTGAARQLVVPPAQPSLASAPPRPQIAVTVPPPATPEAKRAARADGEDAASKRALAEFEALVERARKEAATQQTPSASPTAQNGGSAVPVMPSMKAGPNGSSPSAASPAPATKLAAAVPPTAPAAPSVQAPIPVPITFTSNRIALTRNGERAAALLAEYVRLKKPSAIRLSGHADARGPDGYNMRLSLRRLEAVERYLRAAGYTGELSLVPRGKRDPFQGIDRRRMPLREIYQADRRVELHLTP